MRRIFCISILAIVLTLTTFSILFFGLPVQSAAKEKPIVLTLNLPIPPIHTRWSDAIKPWCDEVTRRTNNRVEIKPYFAQALSTMAENYDSIVKGIADMAECAIGLKPGRLPIMEQMMYFVWPSVAINKPSEMLWKMYEEMPELQNEFRETKLLFLHMNGNMGFGTTKKPIYKIEDCKGLKMDVIGSGLLMDKFKALGFSTVFMPMSDIYMALERGVLDGSQIDWDLGVSRRWGDIVKYINQITMLTPSFYMIMNKKKWDSLPPDIQKVFEEMSGQYAARQFDEYWKNAELTAKKKWETEMGGTTIVFSKEEMQKADNLIVPIISKYVEDSEKNIPGIGKVYNRCVELDKEYAIQ
jgi:TRAP-type C4-dicarboxylate transport system substrate-binding protein